MEQFKALTIYQPWASLVVGGFKEYETRSWLTSYRGTLVIHAASQEPNWIQQFIYNTRPDAWVDWVDHVIECLSKMGLTSIASWPRGEIIGLCKLEEVYFVGEIKKHISDQERIFGDWGIGRFAWKLSNPIRLAEPIPARGRQRLWTLRSQDIDLSGWARIQQALVTEVSPGQLIDVTMDNK